MIYSVIPSRKEKCVFLTCTGNMTLSEMTTAWWLVQLGLSKLGWKRILVDIMDLQTIQTRRSFSIWRSSSGTIFRNPAGWRWWFDGTNPRWPSCSNPCCETSVFA